MGWMGTILVGGKEVGMGLYEGNRAGCRDGAMMFGTNGADGYDLFDVIGWDVYD